MLPMLGPAEPAPADDAASIESERPESPAWSAAEGARDEAATQSEALYLRIESLRSEEQAATQCPEQEETQEPEKASEQEAARSSPAQECGACLKRGRDESGGAPEPVILPAATRQFGFELPAADNKRARSSSPFAGKPQFLFAQQP